MTYKISSLRQHLILTFTPDMTINSGDLSRTELLLNHTLSSSLSGVVFDFRLVSSLNTIGSWTLVHLAYQASQKGKSLFLMNVGTSIQSALLESGIYEWARVIKSQQELEKVLREGAHSLKSDLLTRFSSGIPQVRTSSGLYTEFPEIAV